MVVSVREAFLLPVLLPQALYVRRKALVLPEAAGNRIGETGTGQPLRLLVLGDSSAAGVGVKTQTQALLGHLLGRLTPKYRVQYHLIAQTGLTTDQITQKLLDEAQGSYDLAIIALGVNDVTRLVQPHVWKDQQLDLHGQLRSRFGVKFICQSGLPPMGLFPLLPDPLRAVLGARATHLDQILEGIVNADPAAARVSLEFPLDAENMAEDGYHPSAKVYAAWADRVMSALPANLV